MAQRTYIRRTLLDHRWRTSFDDYTFSGREPVLIHPFDGFAVILVGTQGRLLRTRGGRAMSLTKGTKQYLTVRISTFDPTLVSIDSATFDVLDIEDTEMYTDEVAVCENLDINCLVDTAINGQSGALLPWDEGRYRLFVTFPNTPELPRLGPFEFTLVE